MKVRGWSSWLVAAAVALGSAPLVAAGGRPVDIPERARGARHVVVATATEVTPTWQSNEFGDTLIVSQVQLQVEETLKGTPPSTMWLQVEGGTLNGVTLRGSGLPSMEVGERALFFVDDAPDGSHRPHLKGLGILKLDSTDTVRGSGLHLGQIRNMVRSAGR
jgi:hypothetical protein